MYFNMIGQMGKTLSSIIVSLFLVVSASQQIVRANSFSSSASSLDDQYSKNSILSAIVSKLAHDKQVTNLNADNNSGEKLSLDDLLQITNDDSISTQPSLNQVSFFKFLRIFLVIL